MTSSQTSSNAPAGQPQLGWQARLRWAHGIARGLAGVAQKLDEYFLEQASSVGAHRDMQVWHEAQLSFRTHRVAWVQASAQALQEAARKPPVMAAEEKKSVSSTLTFELLGDDVVENKILASRIAMGMGGAVNSGFEAMQVRIKMLEGQDLPSQDIFRPESLCMHLIEQWLACGLEREYLVRAMEALQGALAQLLASEFEILHKMLDAKGVGRAEDAPLRVRRTESGPSTASTQLGSASGYGSVSGTGWGYGNAQLMQGGAGVAMPPGAGAGLSVLTRARHRAMDVMNQLRQLLSQPGIGIPGLQPGVAVTTAPPASAALAQALHEQQLATTLLNTQPHTQYPVTLGTAMLLPSMDYSPAAMGQLVNLVRDRSADWKQKAETNSEKATIEVVALMFQSILSEDRLPPSIRVWFARLQVPVLRVALAEPQFFSDMNHPARKLIDRMGSCVMGFDASSINGNALEVEIRRVVQVIEQYPETGQKVFALVLREFEAFLTKHLAQSESTARITSVAQQVEQKETLAIQYTIELRNMLADMPVREEVRDFLFKSWADVLAMAAVRYGAKDERAMRYKQAASELVWSASAKPSRQERSRVIQGLPALLQTLREGLELVNVTGDEQSVRIKKLTDTLAEAFVSKAAAIPVERINAMAKRLSELENYIDEDGKLDDMPLSADSIEMMLGVDTAEMHVVPNTDAPVEPSMREWAQALEVGRWFTLDHNGARMQVQYAWRSRRKQLHLFASLDGHCYLLQLQRVAAYLQAGLLSVYDEEALTMRATRDALQKIQANPERLH